MRDKIILVDDNMVNLTMGRNMLKPFYDVYSAASAVKLFEMLEVIVPDLILLDIEMPDMSGHEAIIKLKADERFMDIPVILLTAKSDDNIDLAGFELGAADYISKPFSAPLLLKRIDNQLVIVRQRRELQDSQTSLRDCAEQLEISKRSKKQEVCSLQNMVLAAVTELVEFRDKFTGGHIARTQLYLKSLLNGLIHEEKYMDEIMQWDVNFFLASSQLHDVGKIAISDIILNKPSRLTLAEMEIMKTHVGVGVGAIERIMSHTEEHAFLRHSLLITGAHHERWDGSGYPLGLSGKNIPLEGRLMAIADVYDALISIRPYKEAFTHDKACRIIEDSAGTQFDPVLIDVFLKTEKEFEQATRQATSYMFI